jgi:uncharacterized protein
MPRAFFLFLLLLTSFCWGQGKSHRVVIEVNLPGESAYKLVLNNIENMRKAFAPEPVEVEVVCHGPGLDMLLTSNSLGKRMERLSTAGVVFAGCANTIRGRKIDRKKLYAFVHVVPSGVVEVVRKEEAGWSYLKGAF